LFFAKFEKSDTTSYRQLDRGNNSYNYLNVFYLNTQATHLQESVAVA